MKRLLIGSSLCIAATLLLVVGCRATRAGYESAPYKVVRAEGRFELRDYPALVVVETPLSPDGSDANGSFNRLFRFISGANEAGQKIPMTTPVFMSREASNATMAFVMPAKLKPHEVPGPNDAKVRARQLEEGRFAVLRFRGARNETNEARALQELQARMLAEGLTALSAPVFSYFDPPWTPPPLRRNEVMLRTQQAR
jgi:hypothetical protein